MCTSAGRENQGAGPQVAHPSELCSHRSLGTEWAGWAAGAGAPPSPSPPNLQLDGRIWCPAAPGWAAAPDLCPASPSPCQGSHPGVSSQDARIRAGGSMGRPWSAPGGRPRPPDWLPNELRSLQTQSFDCMQPFHQTCCCQPILLLPAELVVASRMTRQPACSLT